MLLNGKYAQVIHREYLDLAKRAHPANQQIESQTNPGE
jgi:peptidoglycan-associated lipoprotein